jgi:DNA-3-methyladenine glycosylase I
MKEKTRCGWCLKGNEQLYIDYHDKEWGVPQHDDTKLFEAIILDAFQAGLSWLTILKRRETFRKAFDNFDAQKIAKYNEKKIQKLLKDEGIIRNQLKVRSAVTSAQAFLNVQEEFGTFNDYIWQFTDGKTIANTHREMKTILPKTAESDAMSKALQARGFRFVGSTICYAFMQAVGMVNDHVTDCFRYNEVGKIINKR